MAYDGEHQQEHDDKNISPAHKRAGELQSVKSRSILQSCAEAQNFMTPPAYPPLPATASQPSPEIQAALDVEYLRLLKIAYYISGGVTAAFSSIFIFHFTVFLVIGLNPHAFPQTT